jgi:hypothetical protein
MFPQLKKLNNESGIVLFIMLMTAIIIMIFSVGILTQSVNEINYAQQQIDQIACDQWAKGIFWNAYASGMNGVVSGSSIYSNITGRSYEMTITNTSTNSYNVVCNYDTF